MFTHARTPADRTRRRPWHLFVVALILALIGTAFSVPLQSRADSGSIRTWSPPSGTAANSDYTVSVRSAGTAAWTDLFTYKVKLGHQDGSTFDASMVNFDFSGTIDVRVVFHAAPLTEYEIRPTSYGISGTKSGDTVTFSLTQGVDAPRKVVFRANGDWEQRTLHILTASPEADAPDPSDPNVFVVQPGQAAPFQLPAGKDTYYFAPGEHTLPRGMWAEFDLGAEYPLDRIELAQTTFQIGIGMTPTAYPNKFTIETKRTASDPYQLAVDGRGNTQTGVITPTFAPKTARYIRLNLLGSLTAAGFQFSNAASELRAFAGASGNLAQGRAVAGATPDFVALTDGSASTAYASESGYGNWHAGETFFIRESSTVYLAPGSVVHGGFASDGVSDITIAPRHPRRQHPHARRGRAGRGQNRSDLADGRQRQPRRGHHDPRLDDVDGRDELRDSTSGTRHQHPRLRGQRRRDPLQRIVRRHRIRRLHPHPG